MRNTKAKTVPVWFLVCVVVVLMGIAIPTSLKLIKARQTIAELQAADRTSLVTEVEGFGSRITRIVTAVLEESRPRPEDVRELRECLEILEETADQLNFMLERIEGKSEPQPEGVEDM